MPYKRRNVRKVNRRRKAKRWYVDASIPKSVPFIGGSSFKAGSGTLQKMVKRAILNQEESKFLVFANSATTLLHDTFYTAAPWQLGPLQGTAVNQRVGSDIFLKSLVLNANLTNVGGVFAKVRFIGVWADKQLNVAPAAGQIFTSSGAPDLFFTSSTGYTQGLINNKLDHVIICDRTYTIKPDYSGEIKSQKVQVSCPINKRVTYGGISAPMYFKDKQLYFVLIPYTPGGNVGTTQVINMTADLLMTYKDA